MTPSLATYALDVLLSRWIPVQSFLRVAMVVVHASGMVLLCMRMSHCNALLITWLCL